MGTPKVFHDAAAGTADPDEFNTNFEVVEDLASRMLAWDGSARISGIAISDGGDLTIDLSSGKLLYGGVYIETDALAALDVNASSTNYIFLKLAAENPENPKAITSGDFHVDTDNSAPAVPYVFLGTATTDGATVTGTDNEAAGVQHVIATVSSVSAPGSPTPGMIWHDRANEALKYWTVAGAWVTLYPNTFWSPLTMHAMNRNWNNTSYSAIYGSGVKIPNQANIKKIYFAANFWTNNGSYEAAVKLYDSGGSAVTGSELTTTDTDGIAETSCQETSDIFANVTLGNVYHVRRKIANAAATVNVGPLYLILERTI